MNWRREIRIGLGIDFAIHLYDRYHSERALGLDVTQAIERTLAETGSGVLTGGATTILAFCTLLLARVDGIMELGWLVAAGLFFCLISICFVLPSFLAWKDLRRKGRYAYQPLRDFGLKVSLLEKASQPGGVRSLLSEKGLHVRRHRGLRWRM